MSAGRGTRNPWRVLEIAATHDARLVKRAYAKKLKVTRPEDDPEAFQELRRAYELALHWAENAAQPTFETDDESAAEPESDEPESAASEEVVNVAGSELFVPRGVLPVAEREPSPVSGFELAMRVQARLKNDSVAAAINELQCILRSTDHENLDAAADLEQELIQVIARCEPFPMELAQQASTRYGWTLALRQRNESSAKRYVLQRLLAREWHGELRRLAHRDFDTFRSQAKLALLSPWEDTHHRRMAFMNTKRDAMRSMIREAERYVPGFVQWEIDPRVWAFWSAELARPRLQAWHLGFGFAFSLLLAPFWVAFDAFAWAGYGIYQLALAWVTVNIPLVAVIWGYDRLRSAVAAGLIRHPLLIALDYLQRLGHDLGPYGRLAFVCAWLLMSLSTSPSLSRVSMVVGILALGLQMGFKRIPAVLGAAAVFRRFSAQPLHDWFHVAVSEDNTLLAWCVAPFLLWSAFDALFARLHVKDGFWRGLITSGWASGVCAALTLLTFACFASGASGGQLITVFFSIAISSGVALFVTDHFGGLHAKRLWQRRSD